MKSRRMKRIAFPAIVVIITAIGLSAFWHVPYIFTLIGFSGWAFLGHLITADDDLPGGWSNPEGNIAFPWGALSLKGLVFLGLCIIAGCFPVMRGLGASP